VRSHLSCVTVSDTFSMSTSVQEHPNCLRMADIPSVRAEGPENKCRALNKVLPLERLLRLLGTGAVDWPPRGAGCVGAAAETNGVGAGEWTGGP